MLQRGLENGAEPRSRTKIYTRLWGVQAASRCSSNVSASSVARGSSDVLASSAARGASDDLASSISSTVSIFSLSFVMTTSLINFSFLDSSP